MKHYIEKETLIKTLREAPFTMSMCLSVDECNGMNRARSILADTFEIIPAADVVEVVRCKDCKHAKRNDKHRDKPLICYLTRRVGEVKDSWFCADGERREET